jgi:hypothetical protein
MQRRALIAFALAMLGAASTQCRTSPCVPSCDDGFTCDDGTCRENPVLPTRTFCEAHVDVAVDDGGCASPRAPLEGVPGDRGSPGERACQPAGAPVACCPEGQPYFCPSTGLCTNSQTEAETLCERPCQTCAGIDAGDTTCPPSSGRCDDVAACCPCDKPNFGCGFCFSSGDDADHFCASKSVVSSDGASTRMHVRATCTCR